MDASSYLKRHGWRGDGHPLDHTGKGIKKPLLVSKKVDVLGVGLSKHTALSDQWWLKAFDSALKDIGTGKQSMLSNVQKHGVKNGDLYGRFVKGEGMAGTIGESVSSSSTGTPAPEVATMKAVASGKRKRGDEDEALSVKAAKLEDDGVDRKVKKLMREAVRCGIIPPSSREVSKGVKSGSKSAKKGSELSQFVSATGFSAQMSDDVAKQEKTRRDFKRAAKKYLSGEPVGPEDKLTGSRAGLSSKKLAEYSRRAQEKGLSLEDYVKRREAKNASKPSKQPNTADDAALTFVVDITGDPTLATRKSNAMPPDFSRRAIDGISAGELTVITNDAGDEIFNWHPGMPIPLDPRIWEGADVKQLPKPIRKARRAWMAEKRDARQAKKSGAELGTKKAGRDKKK